MTHQSPSTCEPSAFPSRNPDAHVAAPAGPSQALVGAFPLPSVTPPNGADATAPTDNDYPAVLAVSVGAFYSRGAA